MKMLAAHRLALSGLCAAAPPTVFRCENGGKVNYSDSPCVGAKVIDVTPTQGVDKMTRRSNKGKDVRREEFRTALDYATRQIHGLSHGEMDVVRRRQKKLSSADQIQRASLDRQVPAFEVRASKVIGSAKEQAEVELYQARNRVFDLKC